MLAASAVVNSIGTGLYLALIPVYAVLHIGIDPVRVGVVVGVANLVALASPLPADWLTDRYGEPHWRERAPLLPVRRDERRRHRGTFEVRQKRGENVIGDLVGGLVAVGGLVLRRRLG